MSFYIFGRPGEPLRIKSFSSSTKGTKGSIRIELETSDLSALGYALASLDETQKGQRTKPKPELKAKVAKPAPLALPSPQLALPQPGGCK